MKEKLIHYFENTRQYYGEYHNHKEISAWAGLALYVVIVGIINLLEIPKNKIHFVIILIVFVAFILFLILRYINIQLKMKDIACSYSSAAFMILAKLISKDYKKKDLKKIMKIKKSCDDIVKSSHFLPAKFLEESNKMNPVGRGFQDRTRSMIYGIIILVTLMMLLKLWINFG